MSARQKKTRYPHIGRRPGYGTYVSLDAIREWSKLPIKGRLAWIEEMIRLERSLPKPIQEAHRKFREGRIGPVRTRAGR